MTENIARQPKGVPVGGQFAATAHTEPALSLTPRRPELAGWPESLPEPELSFHMGDDSVITTSVNINGEPAFDVWNPGEDVHSIETSAFEHPALEGHEGFEAAESWAKAKHEEMAATLRTEMHAAVERSGARVLAAASGAAPQLSDDELGNLVTLNQAIGYVARRDGEYAATAVIARGVLKDYPDASHIGLRIDFADNGEFVSGAVVYNAAHEKIGYYDADGQYLEGADEYQGAGFSEHLAGLTATPENSWWAEYNMPGINPDDAFTIDLHKAAAWTPAAAQ